MEQTQETSAMNRITATQGPGLDRRELLRLGTVGALATVAGGLGCRSVRRKPNVLFIAVDDLNNWVGCLGGHPDSLTPNIDRLAARSMLFTHAYSPGTNCNATRTALLTGMEPDSSRIFTNSVPFRSRLPDAVTLPEHFRANGYQVIGGGKIFHEAEESCWQEYHQPEAPELFPRRVPDSGYGFPWRGMLNWGPVRLPAKRMWDGRLAAWAAKRLRALPEPFFLAVGFLLPHLPWFAPREYFRPFRPRGVALPTVIDHDVDDLPRFAKQRTASKDHRLILDTGQWRHAVSAYLSCVHFADAMVGKVLDALDGSPLADHTLIVLWSDHGFHHGQKRHWHKYLLWDQATQVPFIISAPGITDPGRTCHRPVSLIDIFPTLVDLCGLAPAPDLDGASLRPLLTGSDADWDRPAVTSLGWGSYGIRTDRWRYIRYADGSEELYDHDWDPLEWTNLAGRSRFQGVKDELSRWLGGPWSGD
jgi:arylsulfatase A-like enzyme